MKKIIYSVFALLLTGATITSCQKESVFDMENTSIEMRKEANWGINRHWSAAAKDCIKPAIECFDDIVVVGIQDKFNEFCDAVDHGSVGIKNYFNSPSYESLFPHLKGEELSKLQSGIYTGIRINNGAKSFFLFGKESDLNEENPEFVLVLSN